MKKILFIASLNTKKERYDGERIKSTFMYESMKKCADVTVINLSTHKIFNTIRIFWNGLFHKKKYDRLIISKDPHGANIIMKILRFVKYPLDRITYFEIGPFLYDRIINGSIKKETFFDIDIIVETKSMKEELESLGFTRLSIYPNFKPVYDISSVDKKYPVKTLKLIYFSRISEMKGIYDLIDCVLKINAETIKYTLDIYGRFETKEDEDKIMSILSNNEAIKYMGKLDLNGPVEYQLLADYDLHVFPTKYSEGFPGTIIDFFIAGVPTLSSTFERAKDILIEKESFFFSKDDSDDLFSKLNFIYENQNNLSKKRKESFARKNDFSVMNFEAFFSELIK